MHVYGYASTCEENWTWTIKPSIQDQFFLVLINIKPFSNIFSVKIYIQQCLIAYGILNNL